MAKKRTFFSRFLHFFWQFFGIFQKKSKKRKIRKIAISWGVFEAVRCVKSSFFIAASWRTPEDLQDAAIKKELFRRRTASKTPHEIAIFRKVCWYTFFFGQFSFCDFEAVRRVKSSFFIAASCRSRRVLQDAAIKKELFRRRTWSNQQNHLPNL